MKTKKILPSINNIDFAGRLTADPRINKSGTVASFQLIRNFGGDKPPVVLNFTMFKPKAGFPDYLKKGAPVVAHAYFNPDTWTNREGEEESRLQIVVKRLEPAEMIEKTVADDKQDAEPVDIKSE